MKQNKIILIDRLNATLKDLYHNASVNYAYDDMESYTALTGLCAYEKFNFFASDAIEYINDLLGLTKDEVYKNYYCKQERKYRLIARLILEYGQVYSYGQGGKTVAPRNLMDNRRNPSPLQYDYNEITASEATDLSLMVTAFNDYITQWCSKDSQKELFKYEIDYIKDELQAELLILKKALKEKMREYRYMKKTSFTEIKSIVKDNIINDITNMKDLKKKLKS